VGIDLLYDPTYTLDKLPVYFGPVDSANLLDTRFSVVVPDRQI
jgi:hypothetical protein